MSQFDSLFLLLVALYLSECVVWVRRDVAAFRAVFGRKARFLPGNRLLGGEEGALLWANPLPPFGLVYLAEPVPVSMSTDGVLDFVGASFAPGDRHRQPEPRFRSWSDVRDVSSREKVVFVDGGLFVRTTSPRVASHLAAVMTSMVRATPKQREQVLDAEVARQFDLPEIGAATGRAERMTSSLVWTQTASFALLFVAMPVLHEIGQLELHWPWLVLAFAVVTAVSVARVWTVASKLARGSRWKIVLLATCSPLSAMRARDTLTRETVITFHPLAVAKVLCDDEEFARVLGAAVRDARHPYWPDCTVDDERARRCEASWRRRVTAELERLSPRLAHEAVRAPARLAADCLAYCPRCAQQYTRIDAVCGACGDRPLVPFSA